MGLLIFIIIYLAGCGFFLAKKDAESYLMKVNVSTPTVLDLIKRWHADGVILGVLIMVPFVYDHPLIWWQILAVGILLRLAEFDLVFNAYAKLSITYLGSTAFVDKIFSKIFGPNGAVLKSLTFFAILIAFVIAKFIFKF